MYIMIGGDTCLLPYSETDIKTESQVFLIGVALKIREDIFYQLRPARHENLIKSLCSIGMDLEAVIGATRGFLTNQGNFVTRNEAFTIAEEAKQLCGVAPDAVKGLSSYNVW